ncbi:EAL domain-containing protein (putative c-di-GMP-specific phosphodiesterase class I)/GGDEF domain-containing protein [Glaciimonas immobilis]|uniref:EAL domain-containing protein (Putative c-di-GMP-specific phosphodiesterase class I)/GGDEF domain-containing protein n=2 Tax=Glaciimonas immobilis TaxID=728004 RepID=A0A840RRJ4_9BURK|nr:GGDEF domain-containing protein [Glaciimonas immobilis]MBB5200313.1 EAL domain-containing protein (putative c-di-GMP-specific phosphodiesterase class I)/GGDEF domain-containing protein [Glaciimonas immobilis]
MLLAHLQEILVKRQLSAIFQPIAGMQSGVILGYEGLIRGPSDSLLHSPMSLFKVAKENNFTVELEHLCRRVVLERFAELQLPGKLFLNISPEALLQPDAQHSKTLEYIQRKGLSPDRVVIELTESLPTIDYQLLREAAILYRLMGFQIAIDDLGEGFSSLRLWSELRPEYVKIDMHFIQGINLDPVKLQFVRSIQEIANKSGAVVIAEGIETQAELLLVRDLGIAYGQGYHIARPKEYPARSLSTLVVQDLRRNLSTSPLPRLAIKKNTVTAFKLMLTVPIVTPTMHNNQVYDIFVNDPDLQTVPVVENGKPLGLITRANLIDRFARPYLRELHGKKACTLFMDSNPMITDKDTSLQELSQAIVDADRHHLFNGFIITAYGQYLGMGTGHDLMREITQMQICAASYANPLTLLPGNVPINEHIDYLLQSGVQFHACYVDLDHFKPFNDAYGYRKGDDIIQLIGTTLIKNCDPDRDFIGHIGGDDFILLFQSEDWEQRCQAILATFGAAIPVHYDADDGERGGFYSEDRRGNKVFYALVSVSLGVVKVQPGQYYSHHQIATAAAEAKKRAKKIAGNSLFIDRRQEPQLAIA